MRTLVTSVSILALSLSGCAYVPDLETEDTFSYAQIVNQLECETYFAVKKLYGVEADIDGHTTNIGKKTNLAYWALKITLNPIDYFEGQASLASTHTTVKNKAGNSVSWALGGTTAASGGLSYDNQGTTSTTNSFNIKILSLFKPTKNAQGEAILPPDYAINPALHCDNGPTTPPAAPQEKVVTTLVASEPPRPLAPTVPAGSFSNGYFGIYLFLDRSLAVSADLMTTTESIGFSKEYKDKIQLGVTPGWYSTLVTSTPAIGANAYLDDKISITFTPGAPDAPKPPPAVTLVCIVNLPGANPNSCKQPVVQSPSVKTSAPTGMTLSHQAAPVSPQERLNLQNGQILLDNSTIQQKLNQLQQ